MVAILSLLTGSEAVLKSVKVFLKRELMLSIAPTLLLSKEGKGMDWYVIFAGWMVDLKKLSDLASVHINTILTTYTTINPFWGTANAAEDF